jgi:hypothetical protein
MVMTALALLCSLTFTSAPTATVFTLFFWILGHFGEEIRFLTKKSNALLAHCDEQLTRRPVIVHADVDVALMPTDRELVGDRVALIGQLAAIRRRRRRRDNSGGGKLIRDAADSMERGERLDKETRENLNKFITLIVKREQDKETENLNLLSDEELRGRLKDALKTSLQEELGQQARRFEAHLQRLRDLKTALFSSWDERSDPATMRRCRRELDAALEVTHASL